ncbi:MAG: hypothetical protein Q8R92_15175 [Deltaproteobacteria bacterium]|nr:hypothetical protein [Deltaproteobacteria bacterium]
MEQDYKRVKVRLRMASGTIYVGRVYVEQRKRLTDVLNDERGFISMTEVEENENPRKIPFIAIQKTSVESVTIIPEP